MYTNACVYINVSVMHVFFTRTYIIYIYICENSFLHMHSNTQICIHTPIQSIHTHIHIPVHIHLHLHEHIYACVHTCKTSSKWKYTYTYRYIEMYAYTCMFTYVRIEIYTCIKKYVHVQIHIIYIYVCNGMQNRKFNHTCIWLVYTYAFTSLIQMQRFCLWDGLASQLSSSARLKEEIWALR